MKTLCLLALVCFPFTATVAQNATRLPIQKVLQETIIEEVKLENASIELWVAFLRSKVETSPGVPLNVVIPPAVLERAGEQIITLNLKKVPAEAVLKYCTQLSGISYKVESRAVVLVP